MRSQKKGNLIKEGIGSEEKKKQVREPKRGKMMAERSITHTSSLWGAAWEAGWGSRLVASKGFIRS